MAWTDQSSQLISAFYLFKQRGQRPAFQLKGGSLVNRINLHLTFTFIIKLTQLNSSRCLQIVQLGQSCGRSAI